MTHKTRGNEIYVDGNWVYSKDLHWQSIRAKRDILLAATDWAVLPDSPANTPEMLTYRQALRGLPSQTENPDNVAWPDNPLGGK